MPTPLRLGPGSLPALPLAAWEDTKRTLHLYCQIIGKLRLASHAKLNHWWHITLYPSPRGIATGCLRCEQGPVRDRARPTSPSRGGHALGRSRGRVRHRARAHGGGVLRRAHRAAARARHQRPDRPAPALRRARRDHAICPGHPRASLRPRRGRAVLERAHPDSRRARGVSRALRRQVEPGAPVLAPLRSRRRRATAAGLRRWPRPPATSSARRTRTRSSRRAGGPATPTSASPRFTRTPHPRRTG